MRKQFKVGDFISINSWIESGQWTIPDPKVGEVVYIKEDTDDGFHIYLIRLFCKVRPEYKSTSRFEEELEKKFDLRYCGWTDVENLEPLNFKETIWLKNKLKNGRWTLSNKN